MSDCGGAAPAMPGDMNAPAPIFAAGVAIGEPSAARSPSMPTITSALPVREVTTAWSGSSPAWATPSIGS